ncbi:Zn-dependent alcohol dehydrogenase [Roseibacterium sp. SDUM158017]|uniref:Zn-dependent alcohol dehydrogenase n=1 Tax=Roseicyclus salinarum TaxID=3036773 RepID=UPI0024158615|nr:Zn-dependent alcohol dehydrogenase [Roseibacterium sp. SDUM158017]MDG4649976.1 Zn-dependent alcohol dehydrogenase [Roseibacterium sp. SDUM158017]
MPSEIRAAVCHEFDSPLRIETVRLRDPGPGEVEVTLEAVAICHSDISYIEGGWGGPLPSVYGHEAAGRVTVLGPGVAGVAAGDRVIATLIRSCGSCPSCASAKPVFCSGNAPLPPELTFPDGRALNKGLKCGAFAEKVVVHASQIARVGDAIPATSACLLACGVPTGLGAVVNTARVRPGESVVVIGCGGVGLNAVQGARLSGAARIIAMDLEPSKLEDARAFGATHGVPATEEKPWQAVRALTGGRGADHVFVSVGAIPAYDMAPRLLAPGGTVYAVGMPHTGAMSSYEPVIIAATGQGMRGSLMGEIVLSRDVPWMVDLYEQGRLELDALVSRTWPLDRINEAIADTRAAKARRNVIVF